jgi:hypothetical protein
VATEGETTKNHWSVYSVKYAAVCQHISYHRIDTESVCKRNMQCVTELSSLYILYIMMYQAMRLREDVWRLISVDGYMHLDNIQGGSLLQNPV